MGSKNKPREPRIQEQNQITQPASLACHTRYQCPGGMGSMVSEEYNMARAERTMKEQQGKESSLPRLPSIKTGDEIISPQMSSLISMIQESLRTRPH
jgi:hypothetical protein